MAILQYWCPIHHTNSRLTRAVKNNDGTVKFRDWEAPNFWNQYKGTQKAVFNHKIPLCPTCRKEMVYIQKLPKKEQ